MPSQSLYTYDLTGKLPELDADTALGIGVAVAGNILISFSLTLQKRAHQQLEHLNNSRLSLGPSLNESDELENLSGDEPSTPRPVSESDPLLPLSNSSQQPAPSDRTLSGLLSSPFRKKPTAVMPVDIITQTPTPVKTPVESISEDTYEGNESDYLKSKLWWIGFLLMNVGELGNFISYAWAPASVVAPLGTFALIANCFFAPLILNERFRKRDLLGILFAIIGAVTVVLASNTSETRLDPDRLLKAISQTPFIIYSCIYIIGAISLSILSERPVGRRYVFVDVGLCGLFGGFTVLSTKAVSTLLTMQWIDMFTHPITYPVLLVLAVTGVGQIRYLNRALMKFDSKIVIPVQFVLFNLSAIVGSAILYGDFQKANFHQVVTFLYGCAATFLGVFVISSESAPPTDPEATRHEVGLDAQSSHQSNIGISTAQPRRATLVMPRNSPELRHRQSTVSLMGLSNAHHLLLVHTPPRETYWNWDRNRTPTGSPDVHLRSRAMSWFGENRRDILPRESSVSRHPVLRTRATVDGTSPSPS